MKKLLLVLGIAIGFSSLYNEVQAQHVSVNININSQPAWGPVGYDYVNYYYFPDINVYFNVNSGRYHYQDRGRWISSQYLPYMYSSYDLYGLYKVVLNVNNPWRYNSRHCRDYRRYVGYRGQVVIRDSRDARYYNSRRNHVSWYSDNYRPNNGRNHVNRPNQNWNNNRKKDYNYNQRDYNKNYNNNRDNNKNNNRDNNRPSRNQGNSVNKNNSRSNSRSNSSRPSYNNNSRSQSNNKGRSESTSRDRSNRSRSASNSNARVYSVNR